MVNNANTGFLPYSTSIPRLVHTAAIMVPMYMYTQSHCTVKRLAPPSHSENLSRLGYIPLLFLAGGRVGEGGGDTESSDTTVGTSPATGTDAL